MREDMEGPRSLAMPRPPRYLCAQSGGNKWDEANGNASAQQRKRSGKKAACRMGENIRKSRIR